MSSAPASSLARLRSRMLVLLAVWVLLLVGLGVHTVLRLQALAASLESIYQDRVLAQQQLKAVGDAYGRRVTTAFAALKAGSIVPSEAATQLAQARAHAAKHWQLYLATVLVADEHHLIEQARPLLERADAAVARAEAELAVVGPTKPGVATGVDLQATGAELQNTAAPLQAVVDALFALQASIANVEVAAARSGNRRASAGLLGIIVAGFVLGGVAAWALFWHYARQTRQSEAALRRVNDFYAALSKTNNLILREQDARLLLSELCRICAQTGHTGMTAVFLLEGRHAVRIAVSGPESDFFAIQPARWSIDEADYRQSPTAMALDTGVRRVAQLPRPSVDAEPWRQRIHRQGIQAIAAFPIRRAGEVHGALSLYAAEADFFDEALVRLLTEMAGNVSFALDNIDREAARLRLQLETQQGLDRFQKLFRSSPLACIISTLADATVLEVNDVMCVRYGLRREDVVGKPRGRLGSLLVEADAQVYRERLLGEGRVRNLPGRTPLPDGSLAEVIVNAETIDYQGQPCVLAMMLDVTELRASEAAQQARAAAEAANRAKTAFLSHMSHELRTPLNAMLGFTQLMQADAGTRLLPADIDKLEHIRQAGWHLLSLINDVMDVSRIEAGHFEVRPAPVALAATLDHALRLTAATAQAAGVAVSVAPALAERGEPGELTVLADPLRLSQVLINLLSNACKYNRPGGTVRVDAHVAAGQVVMSVADTGLGMSDEQLQHLFEPFNRLGRERGAIEGTGLGLALTRQLVELMGGTLVFESRLGVGTTVRVGLPQAPPGALAASTAADPDEALAEPCGTVLYIEDNEINVMLIEEMLRHWSGVRLVHAADGETGLAQAASLQPDLVLMDMHLPDMNGLEILRRLRQTEATAALRVVALSGTDAPADIDQARACGAADYWTKPVELDGFLRGVSRYLAACRP